MRFGFALRTAISLLAINSLPSLAQRAVSPDWRGVDRALEAALDSNPHADSIARGQRAWRRFEAAIGASLRAGLTPDSINRILARRSGYQGPTAGEMALRTASATFWRELPRNTPSFYVAALEGRSPEIVIGVFQFAAFVNGPSALSLYARVDGNWRRVAGFWSDRRIAVYPIARPHGMVGLATLETWVRADGSESELKLWRFSGESLGRIPRADTTKLQDADVVTTDSSVVLSMSQFPRAVSACTMCTRLAERHEIIIDDADLIEHVYSLNPWAALVDQLYGHLSHAQVAAARQLFADSAPLRLMRHHTQPEFWTDSGDFERGEGFAIVGVAAPNGCPTEWRIASMRQADNSWRIVRAEIGLWDADKQLFTVPEKNKLPRICF